MRKSFAVANVASGIQYLFYDTITDGKRVITACGVGRLENGSPLMTDVASKTLDAAAAYAKDSVGDDFTVVVQEIATAKAAPVRVAKALKAANEKSVVFFLCRSDEIYDAAVAELCVEWKTSFETPGGVSH